MPKTIETTVYEYDELNDTAKEKARIWFSECVFDHEWWDSTYEDAKLIGLEITSFDTDTDRNRHAKGRLITSAPECAEKITAEHGKDCETFKTASEYLKALSELDDAFLKALSELDDAFLKDLLEDYAMMLQREAEYMLSDEYLEDGIRANEYTFTESGKRFG